MENNLNNQIYLEDIPAEKFEFAQKDKRLSDKKLDTKPIGYFKDAFMRFCRNKSSVIAASIICVLVLFAILVPIFCSSVYTSNLRDNKYLYYSKLPPKIELFEGTGFWDGTVTKKASSENSLNQNFYNYKRAIGVETGMDPIVKVLDGPYTVTGVTYYDVVVDAYYDLGMVYIDLRPEEYKAIQEWQNETGIQVIYPVADKLQIPKSQRTDANIWYLADDKGSPIMAGDKYQPIYRQNGNDGDYASLRVDGDPGKDNPNAEDRYRYANITGDQKNIGYECRISKYNYFIYRYGEEPAFAFGTTEKGQDILTRLASAARFSLVFAVCIAAINLIIGAVIGAIMGYYGGWVDILMDRLIDILGGVPFMVVATLFQLHLANDVGPVVSMLFAFVLTGWIGMAGRVRMQFYRFKGQEYILAARTLGASDGRLMFKHIFPNALGTIITGSILVIPGVIFSESSLTYLNIVQLDSSVFTTVGTMLANGRGSLQDSPFIILFPALFISLLEISFNLFGNGLRDAFNPSLRGVDE